MLNFGFKIDVGISLPICAFPAMHWPFSSQHSYNIFSGKCNFLVGYLSLLQKQESFSTAHVGLSGVGEGFVSYFVLFSQQSKLFLIFRRRLF